MQSVQTWLATTPVGSWAKTFVAILIADAVGDWATQGAISFTSYQTWLISAAVAVVPAVYNYLNPSDPRYGRGSTAE